MAKIKNLQCYLSFILLNQSMTSSVFFLWFKLSLYLSSLFTVCIINLLKLPSSFLARSISCTDGLFWTFSLWSFSVIKQLLSPLMSRRCSTSLSFRMFLPLMLILFLMLLLGFWYVEVREVFKKILYWSKFKTRYSNHKKSFNHEKHKNDTQISNEFCKIKASKEEPVLVWKILGHYQQCNVNTKLCLLCLNEKLQIASYRGNNMLNKQTEIISECRHRNK